MVDATIEQRLAVLEAKDEIRELTARYCLAVAEGEAETIIAMFTGDGVFTMRDREFAGTDQLRVMYTGAADGVTPKPFIQNHVIEVAGDEATGRCGVEIRMVNKGEAYTVAGHYFDRYRKVDGRWLFARRDFRVYHWVPLSTGWA
ncbi:MAG: nuclear transport factor 2 family protein [Acidimicrobiia bacterium]|nr:nuclear transport factor 2 family protein [Acidimicrobiia bacterium]MDH5288989.1 nuclear transport factor 2 family protein [Acidimicrobiia bacterium]